jgi:hypothetical protein
MVRGEVRKRIFDERARERIFDERVRERMFDEIPAAPHQHPGTSDPEVHDVRTESQRKSNTEECWDLEHWLH